MKLDIINTKNQDSLKIQVNVIPEVGQVITAKVEGQVHRWKVVSVGTKPLKNEIIFEARVEEMS